MDWLEACRDQIFADYAKKTPGSRALFDRARAVLPGGVSGNLRYFEPYPLYMQSGDGCRAIDVDGASYVDCFLCNGPLLLGHRHPAVMRAIAEVERVGTLVVNPELMVACAEQLKRSIPSAERVRFLNSGTEAVMTAVRYARAYTGKSHVVKFQGHYHGQDDPFLLAVGPDREPFGDGIPPGALDNTLTLPCNDLAAVEALIASRDDIAAILVDPAMHAGGLWGVERDFLIGLRACTQAAGIVLIFDEVITGFRMGLGGAQQYHGVTPDLTTLAKALSAGEKLAAVVGSAEVMAVTDPLADATLPRVFQSGTGNDGTTALAAAIGAIGEYERLSSSGGYEALWARAEKLEERIRSVCAAQGIGIHVNRLASMMQIFLTDQAPEFEAYSRLDNAVLDLLFLGLINEGVILSLPTSNHIYFSFMHDEAAFDEIADALARVLDRVPLGEAYRQRIERERQGNAQ